MQHNTETAADRRTFDRFDVKFPAKFKDTRAEFGDQVYLRNASAQGAQFSSKERVYLNDSLTFQVKLPDGLSPMNLRGEVKWVKSDDLEIWDIGLQFHEVSLMTMARLYKFVEAHPA